MSTLFGRSRKNRQQTVIGLRVGPQHLSVAVLQPQADSPLLTHLYSDEIAGLDELEKKLSGLVDRWHLHGALTRVVLTNDLYRLLQADAPNTPLEERDAALAWSLKDVLDFPVAEAIVSSFVPPVSVRTGPDRLYVAVAQKSKLRPFIERIFMAGLEVESIDIPEMCCRNLIARIAPPIPTVAVLAQTGRSASIYLMHDQELTLSRPLTGVGDLVALFSGYENKQMMDQLVLEIQRTLDFYESQLGRRPVGKLVLPPLQEGLAPLPEFLRQNLNVQNIVMDIPHLLPTDSSVDASHLSTAWLAIGAALRGMPTSEVIRAAS